MCLNCRLDHSVFAKLFITIIDILYYISVLDSNFCNFLTLEGGHIYRHDYSLTETVKFFISNARKLNVPYWFSLLSRWSLFRFNPRELFCSQIKVVEAAERHLVNGIFFSGREKIDIFLSSYQVVRTICTAREKRTKLPFLWLNM